MNGERVSVAGSCGIDRHAPRQHWQNTGKTPANHRTPAAARGRPTGIPRQPPVGPSGCRTQAATYHAVRHVDGRDMGKLLVRERSLDRVVRNPGGVCGRWAMHGRVGDEAHMAVCGGGGKGCMHAVSANE